MSRGRRGPIRSAPRRLGEAFLETGKVVKAERERPVEDQAKVDVAFRSRIAPRKRPEKNNLADSRESARFFADRLFYDRRVEVPGFAYFVEDLLKKAFDFSESRVVAGFPVAIQAKPQEMKGRIGLGNPVSRAYAATASTSERGSLIATGILFSAAASMRGPFRIAFALRQAYGRGGETKELADGRI